MYEKLIERLREYPDREETAGGYVEVDWQDLLDASDVIESLAAQLAALQSENAELKERVEAKEAILRLYEPTLSLVAGDKETAIYRMRKAEAAFFRMEAERDAAISDVPHDCEHCNHAVENGACKLLPDGDQFSPDYTDGFDRDGNCDHWDWRGAQGEG